MPSMTEDMRRIAGGIAASRQMRMEAAAERHREAGGRHRAVGNQLHEIKTMRRNMSREQRKDAVAGRMSRLSDVEEMLRQFHQNREGNAAAARAQAAAFMRDLSLRVVALRDVFNASHMARVKLRRDLAKALHDQLAGYRQDRHDADAAWRGMPARQASSHAPAGAHGRHRTSTHSGNMGSP